MTSKTCRHCNKEYETSNRVSIYCSTRCKNNFWKAQKRVAILQPCGWCGEKITTPRFKKFCCDSHRRLSEMEELKIKRREASEKLCCKWCGEKIARGKRSFCSDDHKTKFHVKQRADRSKTLRNLTNAWCLMCGESIVELSSAYRKFCCVQHQLTWKKLKRSNRPIIVRLDHRTVVETKNYYGVAKIKQDWLAKKNAPYLKASEKQQAEEQVDPKDLLDTDII